MPVFILDHGGKMRLYGIALSMALLGAGGVAWAASAPVDKFAITAEEHAACDADAQRLCSAAYPDEDKMLDCMRENRPSLQPVCLSTLDAGLKRRHLRY